MHRQRANVCNVDTVSRECPLRYCPPCRLFPKVIFSHAPFLLSCFSQGRPGASCPFIHSYLSLFYNTRCGTGHLSYLHIAALFLEPTRFIPKHIKMATRTKSVNASRKVSVRGRDAGLPSAPIRVSDEARSKNTNASRVQLFGFPGQDRNVLPERPSTSGGPSPHFSAREETERSRAKDDLHLHPLPTHGRVMNSHTPSLPGALPTPAGTPKSSPPLPKKPSLKRADTPESIMDGRLAVANVEEAGIGMALGSPSQQPNSWQSPPPFESARSWSPDEPPSPFVPARQKSRRWKLLGGLFGGSKKQSLASEPQPFYQLQPELVNQTTETAEHANFAEPTIHSDGRADRPGNRGRAYSERHNVKSKPDMRRANTVPMNFDSQDPERERMKTPKTTLDGGLMNQLESHRSGLMLNVDIPSIQMERYSVMFGSVLQKPTSASSSSLLARRQATLERLKTVAEGLPKVSHHEFATLPKATSNCDKQEHVPRDHRHPLPRRASSPQPAKSPAFSLFPNAPARLYAKPGPPSPPPQHALFHRRSNTSPAVPSPSFPSFPSGAAHETRPTLWAPTPQHVTPSPKLKDHISSQMKLPARETSKASKVPSNISTKQQWPERTVSHEKHRQTSDGSVVRVENDHRTEPWQSKPKPKELVRQIMTSPRESGAHSIPGSQSSQSPRTRSYSVSITASSTSTTATSRSASTRQNTPIHSPPPSSLFRSLTTTAAPGTRQGRAHNAALSSHPVSGPTNGESEAGSKDDDEEEREKKIRTAADISIARQISVSREQTRLIIPMRSPSSKRDNSPNALTIGQVASPLGAVAAGIEHSAAARVANRTEEIRKITKERLAAPAAKPNTPTLVVVGDDSTEDNWGGATANGPGGEQSRARGFTEHRHRKSERVILESISTSD